MTAPKGNKFWLMRSKHGRDKIFKTPDDLWNAACEYFESVINNPIIAEDNKGTKNVNEVKFIRPFTIRALCLFLNVSRNYFIEFKKTANQDFLLVIDKIEETIYNQKFEGAVVGIFKENIIARELGLKDKTETDQNVNINWHEIKNYESDSKTDKSS